MKISILSDQHGYLPEIPESDLLLICGDICPTSNHTISFQENWLGYNFKIWLDSLPVKKVIATWGNHDFIGQNAPNKVPKRLKWELLVDNYTTYEGFKIYGSPWQLEFYDWAFNLTKEDLAKKWDTIPTDSDILVLHSPVKGYGDKARRMDRKGYENVGCPALLKKIEEIKPKLVCYGHIHSGRGIYKIGDTIAVNASLVNEKYQPVNEIITIDIDK